MVNSSSRPLSSAARSAASSTSSGVAHARCGLRSSLRPVLRPNYVPPGEEDLWGSIIGLCGKSGHHVMGPVHACRYAWSSTSGRLPGSFRTYRIGMPTEPTSPYVPMHTERPCVRGGGMADGGPADDSRSLVSGDRPFRPVRCGAGVVPSCRSLPAPIAAGGSRAVPVWSPRRGGKHRSWA